MICSRSTIVPYQQRTIARNHYNCWPAQVPVLTSLFLVFFFIRRHTFRSGREEVHCARFEALSFEICVTWGLRSYETAATAWITTAKKVSYCLNFRCHALVAVQGVEQRPQTIGNFNQVLVQLRHMRPFNVDSRVFFIECLSPALEVILGFKYLSN